jgi:hypothetical protein
VIPPDFRRFEDGARELSTSDRRFAVIEESALAEEIKSDELLEPLSWMMKG